MLCMYICEKERRLPFRMGGACGTMVAPSAHPYGLVWLLAMPAAGSELVPW